MNATHSHPLQALVCNLLCALKVQGQGNLLWACLQAGTWLGLVHRRQERQDRGEWGWLILSLSCFVFRIWKWLLSSLMAPLEWPFLHGSCLALGTPFSPFVGCLFSSSVVMPSPVVSLWGVNPRHWFHLPANTCVTSPSLECLHWNHLGVKVSH